MKVLVLLSLVAFCSSVQLSSSRITVGEDGGAALMGAGNGLWNLEKMSPVQRVQLLLQLKQRQYQQTTPIQQGLNEELIRQQMVEQLLQQQGGQYEITPLNRFLLNAGLLYPRQLVNPQIGSQQLVPQQWTQRQGLEQMIQQVPQYVNQQIYPQQLVNQQVGSQQVLHQLLYPQQLVHQQVVPQQLVNQQVELQQLVNQQVERQQLVNQQVGLQQLAHQLLYPQELVRQQVVPQQLIQGRVIPQQMQSWLGQGRIVPQQVVPQQLTQGRVIPQQMQSWLAQGRIVPQQVQVRLDQN